jgi:hypothetical protein
MIAMKTEKCALCERNVRAKGLCRNHYEKDLKERNPQYRDNQRKNHDSWAAKNSGRVKLAAKEYKRKKTAERYNLSLEELDELQENGCQLCGRRTFLCVDHHHVSGEVRGCLCLTCNVGVGWLENKGWREKAEKYLENFLKGEKKCHH